MKFDEEIFDSETLKTDLDFDLDFDLVTQSVCWNSNVFDKVFQHQLNSLFCHWVGLALFIKIENTNKNEIKAMRIPIDLTNFSILVI